MEPLAGDGGSPASPAGIPGLTREWPPPWRVWVFSGTLFVGAFLLFLIQPIAGKRLLPLLGGSVTVWTACMVFFQMVLLAGYLLAHASLAWLGPDRQPVLHLLLMLAGLIPEPQALGAGFSGDPTGHPALWIIRELGGSLGLPLLMVAAGAPMLQAWFSQGAGSHSLDPYRLYVASNLGSLLALFVYPFLVEPFIPVSGQLGWWKVGYGLLMGMTLVCWLSRDSTVEAGGALPWGSAQGKVSGGTVAVPGARLPVGTAVRWIVLSFIPVSLMLGVTSQITMDLAPLPLLWVLPLAVYLLSYILAFARSTGWRDSSWLGPLFAGIVCFFLPLTIFTVVSPVWFLVGYGLVLVLAVGLVCHSELFETRPEKGRLTAFYLFSAIGGFLGGCFNGLVAPWIFRGLHELPVAVALGALAFSSGETRRARTGRSFVTAASVWALGIGLLTWSGGLDLGDQAWLKVLVLAAGIAVTALGLLSPSWFGGIFCLLLVSGIWYNLSPSHVLAEVRSFYGVYRVRANWKGTHHFFLHGHIHHGGQKWVPESERSRPFYYYIREGPIGGLFREMQRRHAVRIGVVGLGVGTLASYLRPWQNLTFFEIDPVVTALARDPGLFTFLADCAGPCRVVEGDARLSLRSKVTERFELIVLDAYSSDAIPIHLLTREALRIYLDRLAPGGLLALHISHRFLDLQPVVGALARDAGLLGYGMVFRPNDAATRLKYDDEDMPYVFSSHWVVLARSAADFGRLLEDRRWVPLPEGKGRGVWTDDASDVLSCYSWE